MLRVMLVDQWVPVRERLAQALQEFARVRVIGQFDDADSAVSALSRLVPDLIIMDGPLRAGHGMEVLRYVNANMPGMRVIVFAEHNGARWRARWMESGALAFFSKAGEFDRLLDAVIGLSEDADRR